MNRKQKLIVSITGIFIVLLALVGLTYAYFLTRITGNENEKSISVTTANLELVYAEEDDAYVIGEDEIIEPGKTFDTKTFTVTNNGNSAIDSYAVILEDVSITYENTTGEVTASDVTTLGSTIEGKENDFTLVVTCKNQDNEDCTGYNAELLEKSGILLTNSIEVNETQTYTATLTYNETNGDQSADMNKRYNGKFNIIDASNTVDITGTVTSYEEGDYVQTNSTKRVSVIYADNTYKIVGLETGTHEIKVCASNITNCTKDNAKMTETINIVQGETASGNNSTKTITITEDSRLASLNINTTSGVTINEEVKDYNPFSEGTLAYSIFKNALNETNGTIYSPIPLTEPADEINGESEKTLSIENDDYGTSYYFRGNVTDNYINFADMCWKIVRINGDGSIKLVLEDQDNLCADANGNWDIPTTTGGTTRIGNYGYTYDYVTDSTGTQSTTQKYKYDYLHGKTNSEASMATAFKNFQSTFTITEILKLKPGNWCINDKAYATSAVDLKNATPLTETEKLDKFVAGTVYYYVSWVKLMGNRSYGFTPTLKCNGIVMNDWDDNIKTPMYVGTLTAHEVTFAGGKWAAINNKYYLINDYSLNNTLSVALLDPVRTYSNREQIHALYIQNGNLVGANVQGDDGVSFRPAIILNANTEIDTNSGTGLKASPYIVK